MNELSEKKIFVTDEHELFKKLTGNRNVEETRINKILSSVKQVGYITSPVIVNEKMEIIDGQGRVEAFKRIGIPVEYIIEPGLTLKDCVEMNVHQTPWTIMDYIESNCCLGKLDYIVLKTCVERYSYLGVSVISTILLNHFVYDNKPLVKSGNFTIQNQGYEKIIAQMSVFVNIPRPRVIAKDSWWLAILAIVKADLVDVKKLIQALDDYGGIIKPNASDRFGAMQYFEDVYNYNKKKKCFFFKLYVEMMDSIQEKLKTKKNKEAN